MIVRWSHTALNDLDEIYDYIDFRNPQAALRVKLSIVETGLLLGEFPELGVVADETNMRRRVIGGLPYILIYRIVGKTIQIVSVVHGKRNFG